MVACGPVPPGVVAVSHDRRAGSSLAAHRAGARPVGWRAAAASGPKVEEGQKECFSEKCLNILRK